MLRTSTHEFELILSTITHALQMHQNWRKDLMRTLSCRLPPCATIIADDAHLHCAFGQWIHSEKCRNLLKTPTFSQIEALHRHMHESARRVSKLVMKTQNLNADEYDKLMEEIDRFHDAIKSLQEKVAMRLRDNDALTGALNYVRLQSDLQAELTRLRGSDGNSALLSLTIDVASINALIGERAGDQLLTQVADEIRETGIEHGELYRRGGATFVLLLPDFAFDTCEAEAHRAMESIVRAARKLDSTSLAELKVTCSISELNAKADFDLVLNHAVPQQHTLNIASPDKE